MRYTTDPREADDGDPFGYYGPARETVIYLPPITGKAVPTEHHTQWDDLFEKVSREIEDWAADDSADYGERCDA